MSLDPEVEELLGLIEQHLPVLGSVPIDVFRAINSSLIAALPPGPQLERVQDWMFTGPEGPIELRLYVPEIGLPAGVILYFHGGGWAVGDLDVHDAPLRMLAQDAGLPVVSVNYRLAPEHPFPAAVEDAYAALEWVSDALPGWFGAKLPLIVAGDSAGGNLAAVISILARDRQGPEIAAQVLLYPSTAGCDYIHSPQLQEFNPPFLPLKDIDWFIDQYVPNAADRRDQRFAPLLTPNLERLPQALVLTAQQDLLTSEAEAYAQRLNESGTLAETLCYGGTVHGFFSLAPSQRQAVQARIDIREFLQRVLKTGAQRDKTN
ncbi:alpha/beta hydrolase [Pseudomonas umsongensis]|uniref:alpha/beta hydrolase n=1 Tax=Pseudomonas umsongensis TaxID=198618 RepID=UPI0015B9C351|nr:alpha/beta hydrolase [Pseudomonas umsongensis]NWL19158.1 alpha/beta hydrolase [Pseudomonas umsongensis]